MQTVNELKPKIGQRVLVRFESVRVPAVILDAKHAYGRVRFLVSPINTPASNSQWIEVERIAAQPETAEQYESLLARRAEAMRHGDSAAIGQVESEIILSGIDQ